MEFDVALVVVTSALIHPLREFFIKDNRYPEGLTFSVVAMFGLISGIQVLITGADPWAAVAVWPAVAVSGAAVVLFYYCTISTLRYGDLYAQDNHAEEHSGDGYPSERRATARELRERPAAQASNVDYGRHHHHERRGNELIAVEQALDDDCSADQTRGRPSGGRPSGRLPGHEPSDCRAGDIEGPARPEKGAPKNGHPR